ncbi:MAG: GNAT family N-acetyltransferase [Tissierella sp.]|uniref:GNAT family N-acetyltransferase n=1 Tax=Tissierella sp. TaxID=41274 RepID=UPI003F9AE9DF
MFRKANMSDIDRISEIYDEIHSKIESDKMVVGWVKDVYPTRKTAEDSILRGDMFVEEDRGQIVATAIINKVQGPKYPDVEWDYDVEDDKVMVLHTLVVSPSIKGKGYGRKFIKFYEDYSLEQGCKYLRMDTNVKNSYARKFYKELGYKEVGILPSEFYGIEGIELVFLEKKL